jgi:hypothetical protein
MKTSIHPVLIAFALVCFVLLPKAHAVNPPLDGGYPGFNTAEGTNALFNLNIAGASTIRHLAVLHSLATPYQCEDFHGRVV